MRILRSLLLLSVLAIPAAFAHSQVAIGIGVGPVVAPIGYYGYDYGPPACSYGYYPYYPYSCAPYGYYGASWFAGGIFIGAGPWYHGGWYGRGPWYGYGHGGYYGGRPGYGYGGRPIATPYRGGGYNGYNGGARPVYNSGYRGPETLMLAAGIAQPVTASRAADTMHHRVVVVAFMGAVASAAVADSTAAVVAVFTAAVAAGSTVGGADTGKRSSLDLKGLLSGAGLSAEPFLAEQ